MTAEQFGRKTSTFGGEHPPRHAGSVKTLQRLQHPGIGAVQRQPGLTITGNGLLANSIQGLCELKLRPGQLLQAGGQRRGVIHVERR